MLNERIIKALEMKGFKRWTKGTMDRLYINAETLGLELDYYKTGNICSAIYRGESISNNMAREMKAAKTYVDITDGTVHSTSWTLQKDVEIMLDDTMEEVEHEADEDEATTEAAEIVDDLAAIPEATLSVRFMAAKSEIFRLEPEILRDKRSGMTETPAHVKRLAAMEAAEQALNRIEAEIKRRGLEWE